ncbi:ATP-binding protein [Sphingomonas sp. SUN019]|uniref:ATP-binding protein n=1 Tax=Sphingomonas sp. SUN019 TaxID=2937788 RepID=UPI00216488FD|nr:ATP-binding protein [Sphingomonas sp. SUN019]UVO48997.1 ATP-binding protein [Sphingomonas sp. SUN019]
MTLRSICLHGPESTGKSSMAPRLARHFDSVCIAEFGRTYCERYGTDLNIADLLAIAHGHDRKTCDAVARGPYPVILDTDPLMSAVWADMLFGRRDPWFDRWNNTADLYLLFDIDLPWVEDGTRMFGSARDRARFFDLSRRELGRRGVRWEMVSGVGDQRYMNALAAIRRHAGAVAPA